MYSAKILRDSISAAQKRITTFEVVIPRIVLAEFNTHRMLSRNSASSRAIPVAKNIEMVEKDPFIPDVFAQNQSGMQGDTPLGETDAWHARAIWEEACWHAIDKARELEALGVHKALANRILEPFKWHTIIVTATEWDNFFALRCDDNAQAEIRIPAQMMRQAMEESTPVPLYVGDWHLPLVSDSEFSEDIMSVQRVDWEYWKKVSVGRCARVSYLTHDGKRDPQKDIELHDRLMASGHLSPFEHVATPYQIGGIYPRTSGNFVGWRQYRKDIPHESNFAEIQDGQDR